VARMLCVGLRWAVPPRRWSRVSRSAA